MSQVGDTKYSADRVIDEKKVAESINNLKVEFETKTVEYEFDMKGRGFRSIKEIDIPGLASEYDPSKVTSLILAKNLFQEWFTISEIVSKFPNLKKVDVSDHDSLEYPSDIPLNQVFELKDIFSSVTEVVMNACGYRWGPIMCCVREMWSSKLEKLTLRSNAIDILSMPTMCHLETLFELDLSGNPISDWKQVAKLGQLPHLDTLLLANCHIDVIQMLPERQDCLSNDFLSLRKLDLFNNKIAKWEHVLQLTRLSRLSEIDLQWNPVVAPGEKFMDSTIILTALFGSSCSRMNGLRVNKSLVSDAEGFLVRRILDNNFPHTDLPRIRTVMQRNK